MARKKREEIASLVSHCDMSLSNTFGRKSELSGDASAFIIPFIHNYLRIFAARLRANTVQKKPVKETITFRKRKIVKDTQIVKGTHTDLEALRRLSLHFAQQLTAELRVS